KPYHYRQNPHEGTHPFGDKPQYPSILVGLIVFILCDSRLFVYMHFVICKNFFPRVPHQPSAAQKNDRTCPIVDDTSGDYRRFSTCFHWAIASGSSPNQRTDQPGLAWARSRLSCLRSSAGISKYWVNRS